MDAWKQVEECVARLEREAFAMAERSAHISGPELAAMSWERAREKYALAREVEFFGILHPLAKPAEH